MSSSKPELWIVIRHWRRFQHYSDREPPWIKNYPRLLSDDNYLDLTGDQRAILHGLWLEYARSSCRLRLDTRSISARLRLRVTSKQLEALNHAGFIDFSASAPLATRVAREETETEKERTTYVRALDQASRPVENEERDERAFDFDKILRDLP